MATAEPIDPGFSTADAEYPSLTFSRGDLALAFRDWREDDVRVVFRDVWRFDWLDEVPDGEQIAGERWDGTSVIHDSRWIPSTATDACKHYRLNFNDCGGRLDVACESFEVVTQT